MNYNEWIKSKEGVECSNINTITEAKFLENRLFWAFEAGRKDGVNDVLSLVDRCEKTFGKIDEIFKLLLEAKSEDLYSLVREIDIDLPLIQATIKDELSKLK